ncbi:MAG: sulfatase-like hydrolase/transferase [Gemmatimonadaceae bacterium]|nr:sulfatase-like hydrolase/transferase [Gemmatimonadaceae bacterium]
MSKEHLRASAANFTRISLALFPVLLLLRAYEFLLVRAMHVIPRGVGGIVFRGLRSDLLLTLWTAALLAVPVIALAQWHPRAGRWLHRVFLALALLAGTVLVQYFAITFVPLGADLFGYSWSDIRETAMASRGIGFLTLLPPLLLGAALWYLTILAMRIEISNSAMIVFFSALAGVVVFRGQLSLKLSDFKSEADYFLAENKLFYFAGKTAPYVLAQWSSTSGHGASEFPLLRPAVYDDVLGPFMNPTAQKPNLVFVIVEGLGRDFVGDDAYFGGFTPFLDSLAKRSLYWENFLSTTGRTFGVLPALFGSLPYAGNGFMNLGSRMPTHLSLVSLLKKNGYRTSFFTGTNGQFELIDGFMGRQGVSEFVDESRFGPRFERQPASEGGASWGFGDRELFRRSLEVMGMESATPRLDIYLTITTHEPFIPPQATQYRREFERRLATLPIEPGKRNEFRKYAGIFATLLYTDDALRYFFTEYAKRADFARTIFFVTGDHRLIPIPPRSRIDRFHVPFLIFSPMLKAPRRFSSVSSHLDVTPTVLAFLHRNKDIKLPERVHWLGTGIDTATLFRNVHRLALMPNKNQLDGYLDGLNFLSGNQLFQLDEHFGLRELNDTSARNRLRGELERFNQASRFVMSGEHLYPPPRAARSILSEMVADDSVFRAMGLGRKKPEEAFEVAREAGIRGQYQLARSIARRLLRDSPSYYDARALLGRTYSWERRFDEGRTILTDLVRQAPEYIAGHVALIDLEIFSEHGEAALGLCNAALAMFPQDSDLLLRKARALEILGNKSAALAVLDTLQRIVPGSPEALQVRTRLTK